MAETIFDLIEEEIPEGKEGYFEVAKRAPQPKDNSFFNSLKDYGKTIAKGAIEGISKLGTIMGPAPEIITKKNGKIQIGKSSEEELKQQTERLDKLLPTDEGFTQRALRRGIKEAPTMTAFPGSGAQALPRSIAAGFAGEGAKELGLPEWAQTAAELTAFIGPDITRKLLSTGKNKEIIDFAKKMGMTDEQITPLIQSKFKQKWLTKISPKGDRTQNALQNTKEGLARAYSGIQESEIAAKGLGSQGTEKLINSISDKLIDLPSELRNKVQADLNDLLNNKITGKTLMNFHKDINSYFSKEKKMLGILKEPIKEAIHSISPELGKDFELANSLYSKYYPIASKLKPTQADQIYSALEKVGKVSSVISGIMTGNYGALAGVLGLHSARHLSQELLINPRLQQLSKKMVEAANSNKYGIMKKLTQSFANQIKESDPEASKILEKITEEDLMEMLSNHKK